MADRLSIYQGALRLLGPSELSSLSEDIPAKRKLDAAWPNAVQFMLEQGMWNFAIRTVQISASTDVEPLFSFDYAFQKPDDYVRTVAIDYDATFNEGLSEYEDSNGYWFTNTNPIYVRYVSNNDAYGFNVGAWRQSFSKAMECYLAFECGLPISSDRGNRNDLYQLFRSRLQDAKTKDAVDERVRDQPPGRWTRVRNRGYPSSFYRW